jgi:hypothetical protein
LRQAIKETTAQITNADIVVSQIAFRLGVAAAMLYRYIPAAIRGLKLAVQTMVVTDLRISKSGPKLIPCLLRYKMPTWSAIGTDYR